jgi:hypothetical protein
MGFTILMRCIKFWWLRALELKSESSNCLPPSSPTLLAPYGSTFLPPKTAPSGLRRFGLGALLPLAGEASFVALHVWLKILPYTITHEKHFWIEKNPVDPNSRVYRVFWMRKPEVLANLSEV